MPLIVPEISAELGSQGWSFEIIVVDDGSTDGTQDRARALALTDPVRLIERTERGLATAVLAGFESARGDVCAVMDADGSHRASDLVRLVSAVGPETPIAVGSRHLASGGFGTNSLRNRVVSQFAGWFAAGLAPLSDPTSGFMAVRRELLKTLELDPVGWKIVLEVVVKARPTPVAEIPIQFDVRRADKSKQSLAVLLQYLSHCRRLRKFRQEQG